MSVIIKPEGRYCIYLRKSRADLDKEAYMEGETLARHEATLTNLAKNLGIHVLKTYREIVSGDTIADRPEMIQLLRDLRDKKWDGVLVMEVERLARGDASDQGTVGKAFIFSQTAIITPQKIYDPLSETDMQYFEFGLFMSRQEYKSIKKRLIAGRIASAREGQFSYAIPPYGYDKVCINKKHTLKPNEQAPIVRMVFEKYIETGSAAVVAHMLDDMHIPTQRGNKTWNYTTIKNMLRNSTYIGKVSWGKKCTIRELDDDMSTVVVRHELASEYKEYDGLHEPIIDVDTFNQVATMLKSRETPTKRGYEHSNPLAGLIVCSNCGIPINYLKRSKPDKNGNKHSDVFAHSYQRPCDNKPRSCVAKVVIDAIADAIEKEIGNIEVKQTKEPVDGRSALEAEIKTAKKALDGHIDRLERGIIDEETYVERTSVLKERIASLKDALNSISPTVDVVTRKSNMEAALDMLRNGYDVKTINRFLKTFIERIEYNRQGDEPLSLIIFWR